MSKTPENRWPDPRRARRICGVRLLVGAITCQLRRRNHSPSLFHLAAGRVYQTHQRQRSHRFSRTGLTHYRQRLAAAQAEG